MADTIHYLKLEDQYWGLYLIALVLLFYVGRKKKSDLTALPVYGIIAYGIFFCPLTYRALDSFFVPERRYEELSHIWLYVVFLPFAAYFAAQLAGLSGKGDAGADLYKNANVKRNITTLLKKTARPAALALGLVMLFGWAGTGHLEKPGTREQAAGFLTAEEKDVFDMILEDSRGRGDDTPAVWAGHKLMAKTRLYSDAFRPVYGKDILENPAKYSEQLLSMRQGYDLYESLAAKTNNKEDQLGAIANMPNVYPDVELDYVVIYDPAWQGADVSADPIFEGLGYELVGNTKSMRVYYLSKMKGEAG